MNEEGSVTVVRCNKEASVGESNKINESRVPGLQASWTDMAHRFYWTLYSDQFYFCI